MIKYFTHKSFYQKQILNMIELQIIWYLILSFRFLADKESFEKIPFNFKRSLYIFACANSFMNPLVYGFFNLRQSRSPATRVSFCLQYYLCTLLIYFIWLLNDLYIDFFTYFYKYLEHDNPSNHSRIRLPHQYSDDNVYAYAKKSNSCKIKQARRSIINITSY